MTPDEADRIERRLEAFGKEVRDALTENTKAISRIEVLVHAPGECDLKATVADLKSKSDVNIGKWIIVMLAIGPLLGAVGGLIVKFLK